MFVLGATAPSWQRERSALVARTRAATGDPASSPWNSPSCHWRASSQSGSKRRALTLWPMSVVRVWGSSRVQLVIDAVRGGGAPSRGPAAPPAGRGDGREPAGFFVRRCCGRRAFGGCGFAAPAFVVPLFDGLG